MHLIYIVTFQNPLLVFFQWAIQDLTFNRGARLITGTAPTDFNFNSEVASHGIPVEEIESFYASRSLLGRAVTGADVAEAVAFLVSDRSRATTGAVIPVDGSG